MKNNNRRTDLVTTYCRWCGVEMTVRIMDMASFYGQFCSSDCIEMGINVEKSIQANTGDLTQSRGR